MCDVDQLGLLFGSCALSTDRIWYIIDQCNLHGDDSILCDMNLDAYTCTQLLQEYMSIRQTLCEALMMIDHGDMRHDIISYTLARGKIFYDTVVASPHVIDELDLSQLETHEGYIYYGLLEILDEMKTN